MLTKAQLLALRDQAEDEGKLSIVGFVDSAFGGNIEAMEACAFYIDVYNLYHADPTLGVWVS